MFSDLTDKLTLAFFSLTSGGLKKSITEAQYVSNLDAWEKLLCSKGPSVLEYQQLLSDLSYGTAPAFLEKLFLSGRPLTAAENACEVIAVRHALTYLGFDLPFPALLRHFSKKGICAKGLFGTSPAAIEKFFLDRGFNTDSYTGRNITERMLDELGSRETLCLLTSFNKGQDPFSMVHTMCLTKNGNSWIRHNDNGAVSAPTLKKAVLGYKDHQSHPIRLVFIH